jgi:hypothetical protein
MKNLVSFAFAAAMMSAPALIATPAQAQTMEECLAKHSVAYCEAALGTDSLNSGSSKDPCDIVWTKTLTLVCAE